MAHFRTASQFVVNFKELLNMDLMKFNIVIEHLHKPLLGLPVIQALQLISRVNAVGDLAAQVCEKYPQLFGSLGSLTGERIICLNEDAKPFAILTPRRIALPLLPKVKK